MEAINDRFGHQAGDRVLVALAERGRRLVRDYDVVSRWGGEEFIALLPNTDLAGACRIAERLRAEIASMGIREVGQVSCSFGVAECSNGEAMDKLINRADAAVYQANDAGRDRSSAPAQPDRTSRDGRGSRQSRAIAEAPRRILRPCGVGLTPCVSNSSRATRI